MKNHIFLATTLLIASHMGYASSLLQEDESCQRLQITVEENALFAASLAKFKDYGPALQTFAEAYQAILNRNNTLALPLIRKLARYADLKHKIFGTSLLHEAVALGNTEAVISLLFIAKKQVNTPDHNGNTPLHFAMLETYEEENLQEIVELLLSEGADPLLENNDKKSSLDCLKERAKYTNTNPLFLSNPTILQTLLERYAADDYSNE